MRQQGKDGKFIPLWNSKKTRKVKNLYINKEYSLRDIAKCLECSHGAVQKLVNRKGWMRKKSEKVKVNGEWKDVSKITPKVAEEIIKIRKEQQLNYVELADIFDIPKEKLREFLRKEGLTFTSEECGKASGKQERQKAIKFYYCLSTPSTHKEYKWAAIGLARIMCSCYFIDYKSHKKKGFEIDHKLSIKDGLNLQVPIKYISHPTNIRIISKRHNLAKGPMSILTYEDLKKAIRKYNKIRGNPYQGVSCG